MKAYLTLTQSTLKEVFRERSTFFWNFAFPLLFIVVFGLIFGGNDTPMFRIGVVQQSSSPLGAQIAETLASVAVFEAHTGDFDTEMSALRNGDRRAVIVVTSGLVTSQPSTERLKIDIYYDPSAPTVDQVVLPIVRQIVDTVTRGASGQPELYQFEAHSISTRNFRQIDYMTPGILAYSILQLGLFSALPLIILRENKVLKRLNATPLTRRTIVAAQVTTRVVIAGLQLAVIIGFARLIFGVQMGSSPALLIGLVVLGALTFVAMGFAVSSFARTQEGVMPVVQIISLPMMFLSGVFFPVEILPEFMRGIAAYLPLTFLADGLRQVTVGGTPIHSLATNIGALVAWLVVSFAVAIRFFRWS